MIASWSIVCCNELVSWLFFESESSPQKQVKGWPPCVELTVLMKNHRVMIKNFLATVPVRSQGESFSFCSVSRIDVLSEREKKTAVHARRGTAASGERSCFLWGC